MDTIADMLTLIRNAQAVKKETVLIPYSKFKMGIVSILEKEKFINKAGIKGKKNRKFIEVELKYNKENQPAISCLKKVSKQSKRVYIPLNKIKSIQYGKGFQIISSPKGLITNKEAKNEKVGGEVVCEVW